MGKTVFIHRRLRCPDSEIYSLTAEATIVGGTRKSAERAARGTAVAQVVNDLRRAADEQKCPEPCRKVVSSFYDEDLEVSCRRLWWSLWMWHECTARYTASIKVSCELKEGEDA